MQVVVIYNGVINKQATDKGPCMFDGAYGHL